MCLEARVPKRALAVLPEEGAEALLVRCRVLDHDLLALQALLRVQTVQMVQMLHALLRLLRL